VVVRGHDGRDLVMLWIRGRYDHYLDYDTELWGWPNDVSV
jgi:hypothetical protein